MHGVVDRVATNRDGLVKCCDCACYDDCTPANDFYSDDASVASSTGDDHSSANESHVRGRAESEDAAVDSSEVAETEVVGRRWMVAERAHRRHQVHSCCPRGWTWWFSGIKRDRV